jgi:hypothetical protein
MKFFLNCSPYGVNIYLSNQGAHELNLNWIYLHSINPKQVNTFGYRTSQKNT